MIAALIPGLCSLSFLAWALAWRPGKPLRVPAVLFPAAAVLIWVFPSARADGILLTGTLLLHLTGAAAFYFLAVRVKRGESARWLDRAEALEARQTEEENNRRANKILMEKSEREIHKSLSLYGAIRGLGESLSWAEMIPHIDFAVKQCLNLKDFQLYLLDEKTAGAAADSPAFKKAMSRGVRMAEAPLRTPAPKPVLHEAGGELYLEVPIPYGHRLIGILWARVPKYPAVASREDLLADAQELAEELGMGLQKALLFTSLQNLSRIDGLTGVHRRQIFNERLNEELRRAQTFHTPFSVLIADLDHFKRINDTYGHQAGDAVLKRVGQILKESVYETDFVARYGGEEFVILFPQADPAGVKRKAEAIRGKISQEAFVVGWEKLRVTLSLGIAHFPKDGQDPNSLLSAADGALYAAKNGGRNRVADTYDSV